MVTRLSEALQGHKGSSLADAKSSLPNRAASVNQKDPASHPGVPKMVVMKWKVGSKSIKMEVKKMNIMKMARLIHTGRLKDQSGFTMLELLVVVAILAIIAGGLMVAYDGLETKSAKAEASHAIAGVDGAVRNFTSLRGTAPDNLDSMLAATPVDGTQSPLTITGGADIASMSSSLLGKTTATALTAARRSTLNKAGITKLRYIDVAGNVDTCAPCVLTTLAADATAASVGNISKADIPNRLFDVPREGTGKNRGRGYSHTLLDTDMVQVWDAGAGGINNLKVGAAATDVLIAFGLGNNSTITTVDDTAVGDAHLSQAPIYPDVKKNEYGRYVLLYNVGPSGSEFTKARLQGVVDSKGDFLDEELAEYSGQKQ